MFFCFEGIAGSGKTTQVKLLADHLRNSKGKDVFISAAYEGERRKLVADFLSVSGMKSDDHAVMFLFQALHALQYREVVDALATGKDVIADRWRDSFFAHHLYQKTFGDDLDLARRIDQLAFRSLDPEVCLYLDVPPDLAHERYLKRESVMNDCGLELMNREYFAAVSEYYEKVSNEKDWIRLDASGSEESIFEQVKQVLQIA